MKVNRKVPLHGHSSIRRGKNEAKEEDGDGADEDEGKEERKYKNKYKNQ